VDEGVAAVLAVSTLARLPAPGLQRLLTRARLVRVPAEPRAFKVDSVSIRLLTEPVRCGSIVTAVPDEQRRHVSLSSALVLTRVSDRVSHG
jgi:hypothetical protein